jgi:hypothetical protein
MKSTDSFSSVSVELILLLVLSGFGASKPKMFALFALISTEGFLLLFVMDFGARVDYFVGNCSGKFDNFHPFSVAQSVGGLAKGFDHQDWVALPYNLAFYEVPLYTW